MANGAIPTRFQPNTTPAGTPCINPTQANTVVQWAQVTGKYVGMAAGGYLAAYVADGFTGPAATAVIGVGTELGGQVTSYAAGEMAQNGLTAYQQVVNTWDYAMGLYNAAEGGAYTASWYNQSYTQACNESGEYLFGT